jgi:glycosyltransferase involved in cell wall biosynthesis
MSTPRVSVICSVYNGEAYLEESLRSILTQTFEDFELLVMDDGSGDGTPALLEKLLKEDPRVQIFHQETQGLTRTLNTLLEKARGEYVARQDDDDVSWSERLERQVRFLDENPRCAAVGSRYVSIDETGKRIARSRVPVGDAAIKRALLTHNVIAHSSAVYRRKEVLAEGGYDPTYRTAQDYDLWCRLALKHELANLKTPLLSRRRHPGRVGVSHKAEQFQNRDRIREAFRRCLLEQNTPETRTLRLLARLHNLKEALFYRPRARG